MKVFLTGGTGFVGSSVLKQLRAEGHSVTALVRSEEKARAVEAAGATALLGDLTDTELLTRAAQESDGVIHTASPGDETSAAIDDAVVTAVLAGLAGSGKPYVHTGGIWVYGSDDDIAEASTHNPPAITAWRLPVEKRVLKADGIRGIIVVPSVVFGNGAGLPNLIAKAPRTDAGALRLIGDGSQHWTTVHVDDLAALYVLALENAAAGAVYVAASGQNPTVRELGEAAARAASLPGAEPETADESRSRLGASLADALLLDQQATGSWPKIDLGWEPNGPSLVDELASGSYAERS